jgi:hypothetical protein
VSAEGVWGGVYFLSHDPPRLIFEAADLSRWLQTSLGLHLELNPLARHDDEAALARYYDAYDASVPHWRTDGPDTEGGSGNPAGGRNRSLGAARGIRDADGTLRSFCSELPVDAVVLDLRNARPGDYADLDPFAQPSSFTRAGSLPLFAVLPPVRRRWWGRRMA